MENINLEENLKLNPVCILFSPTVLETAGVEDYENASKAAIEMLVTEVTDRNSVFCRNDLDTLYPERRLMPLFRLLDTGKSGACETIKKLMLLIMCTVYNKQGKPDINSVPTAQQSKTWLDENGDPSILEFVSVETALSASAWWW